MIPPLSARARSTSAPAESSAPPTKLDPLPAPTPYDEGPSAVAATVPSARASGPTPAQFIARVRQAVTHTASAVNGHASFIKREGATLNALRVGCAYVNKMRLKGPNDEFFTRLVPSTPGGSSFKRSAAQDRLGKLEMRHAMVMSHRTEAERSLGALLGSPQFAEHFARLPPSDRLALAADIARGAAGTPAARTVAAWLSDGLRGAGPLADLKSILGRTAEEKAEGAHGHLADLAHSFLVATIPSVAATGGFYNLMAEHGHLPGLRSSPAVKVGGALAEAFAALAHIGGSGVAKHPSELGVLLKSGVEVAEAVAHAKHAHGIVKVLSNAANGLGVGLSIAKILEAPIDSSDGQIVANGGRLAGYALALLGGGAVVVAAATVMLSEFLALLSGDHKQHPAEAGLSRMGLCAQKTT